MIYMDVTKSKIYKGEVIRACERVKGEHSGKWIIAGTRLGMEIADELCPHFVSIRAAKAAINHDLAFRASPQAR